MICKNKHPSKIVFQAHILSTEHGRDWLFFLPAEQGKIKEKKNNLNKFSVILLLHRYLPLQSSNNAVKIFIQTIVDWAWRWSSYHIKIIIKAVHYRANKLLVLKTSICREQLGFFLCFDASYIRVAAVRAGCLFPDQDFCWTAGGETGTLWRYFGLGCLNLTITTTFLFCPTQVFILQSPNKCNSPPFPARHICKWFSLQIIIMLCTCQPSLSGCTKNIPLVDNYRKFSESSLASAYNALNPPFAR